MGHAPATQTWGSLVNSGQQQSVRQRSRPTPADQGPRARTRRPRNLARPCNLAAAQHAPYPVARRPPATTSPPPVTRFSLFCAHHAALSCHSDVIRCHPSEGPIALKQPCPPLLLPDSSPSSSQLGAGRGAVDLFESSVPRLGSAGTAPARLSHCGAGAGHGRLAPGWSERGSLPIHALTPFSQSF